MKNATKVIAASVPSRRTFFKRAAVAAGAVAAMGPVRASAQQTITLKLQSGIPPKDIFHEQFLGLARKGSSSSACS
jgi:hypothetical protein